MARGRDAADVALLTSFGASRLERFTVWCDEVGPEALLPAPRRTALRGRIGRGHSA